MFFYEMNVYVIAIICHVRRVAAHDRLSHKIFYAKLITGAREAAGPKKRCKNSLSATLKSATWPRLNWMPCRGTKMRGVAVIINCQLDWGVRYYPAKHASDEAEMSRREPKGRKFKIFKIDFIALNESTMIQLQFATNRIKIGLFEPEIKAAFGRLYLRLRTSLRWAYDNT